MQTTRCMIGIGYGLLPVPIASGFMLIWLQDMSLMHNPIESLSLYVSLTIAGYLYLCIQLIIFANIMGKLHTVYGLGKRVLFASALGLLSGLSLFYINANIAWTMAVIGCISGVIVALIMQRYTLLECEIS